MLVLFEQYPISVSARSVRAARENILGSYLHIKAILCFGAPEDRSILISQFEDFECVADVNEYDRLIRSVQQRRRWESESRQNRPPRNKNKSLMWLSIVRFATQTKASVRSWTLTVR